jgi:hypothetical protein
MGSTGLLRVVDASAEQVAATAAGGVRVGSADPRPVIGTAETSNSAL